MTSPRSGETAECDGLWLNGRLQPVPQTTVAALQKKYLRGLGLLETMRVTGGRIPLLDRHLDRLSRSCRLLARRSLRGVESEIEEGLEAVLRRAGPTDGVARIVVGEGLRLVTLGPLPQGLKDEREAGIRLPALPVSWSPISVKHTSRAPLERVEREMGGETARLGADGRLLETTRSNLFVVSSGALETAHVSAVLPGIARQLIVEMAAELALPVRQRAPRIAEQDLWSECFVTNAVRGVRPVAELAGRRLPVPEPGGVLRQLQRRLDRRMELLG
jgi:branched-subunit amino acid aminotransferase/4-amino-4-deoxychorismate lyase